MTTHPTDSELVAAHLGGDRAALAAIYDRYADSLHDTAVAMLRDRHEAADVVQEVFLVAAQKLDQLRQPERLTAWLFAVLRNEVYLRSRRRSRTKPSDFSPPELADMAAPEDPEADGARVERDELAQLVRAAAGGLDDRDRLVMELSLRQNLSGDDLATAVGVTTKQAHVLVHRMRERLLRSLGAVTVSRMGRDDCDELAALLEDWDGTFTVLVRKRVARHVERCAICDETRNKYPVGALYGAAPVLAAPADLRDAVLAAASRGQEPQHRHRLDRDGFPRPTHAMRGPLTTMQVVWIGLVLVIVAGGGFLATQLIDDGDTQLEAASTDQATTAPAPTTPQTPTTISTSTSTSTPTSADTTIAPSTSTTTTVTTTTTTSTTTTTPPPAPGTVVLSASVIDLGDAETSGALEISNPGDDPVDWTLTRQDASPFRWDQTSGTLDSGASTVVTVSFDRADLGEATYTANFTIAGGDASASVETRARVERAPVISDVRGPSSLDCRSSTRGTVLALISDESSLASVELRWEGPGNPGSATMILLGGDEWEGTLDPEPVDGTWSFTIVATDVRGNTSSASQPFIISGCG